MGFDIALAWREASPDAVGRNRQLADALLAAFPGMTEFPLNVDLIAQRFGVPVSEIWFHNNQIELNAPDTMLGARLELWQDRAYLELPSNPPLGCQAALAAINPILAALAGHGLHVVDPDGVLGEYEAQRTRVLCVAEIVGGSA